MVSSLLLFQLIKTCYSITKLFHNSKLVVTCIFWLNQYFYYACLTPATWFSHCFTIQLALFCHEIIQHLRSSCWICEMKVMISLKNVNEELILSPKVIVCRRKILFPVIFRKNYSSFASRVLCGGHFKKKANINSQN